MRLRAAVTLLVLLLGCGSHSTVDGGLTGGGGGTTGGGSGATGGGGGGETDAGLLFGELCDPTLLQGLITSCRVEPVNPFSGTRCISARNADGGALTSAEQLTLIRQGEVEACSMFGAGLLRCVAPVFTTCEAIRADGGFADNAVVAALDDCNSRLGLRFQPSCSGACGNANDACLRACSQPVAETCAACAFDCGRQYAACLRPCLVLPDAGYPDGG
jgi:hypothetical protein